MNILLARKPTGRKWGDKVPEKSTSVTIDGLKIKVHTDDAWEGPLEAGESGEYYRCYWVEHPTL